jgi:hypothetical protein
MFQCKNCEALKREALASEGVRVEALTAEALSSEALRVLIHCFINSMIQCIILSVHICH